jgi:hypothetical protein
MFLLRLLPPLPREISLAVVGLSFGLFLAVHGALQAYAEATGVPGRVTVTECTPATGGMSDLWQDGWACEGSFDATDHIVSVSDVAVDGVIDSRPAGGTVPALSTVPATTPRPATAPAAGRSRPLPVSSSSPSPPGGSARSRTCFGRADS